MSDHYLLQWNDHSSIISSAFAELRDACKLVDVTLSAGGSSINAHKVVLCACSPYFEDLFSASPCKHPIVYMHNVEYKHLFALVEFIYKGSVIIGNSDLDDVLQLGSSLQVQGLVGAAVAPSDWSGPVPTAGQQSAGDGCSSRRASAGAGSDDGERAGNGTDSEQAKTTVDMTSVTSHYGSEGDSDDRDSGDPPPRAKRSRVQLQRQQRLKRPAGCVVRSRSASPPAAAAADLAAQQASAPAGVAPEPAGRPGASPLVKQVSSPAAGAAAPQHTVAVRKQTSVPVLQTSAGHTVVLLGSPASGHLKPADSTARIVQRSLAPRPPLQRRSSAGPHTPVLGLGPAASCAHCWNTVFSTGRTLRRKTKYMCRTCSVRLCIVPCFQEFHDGCVRSGAEPAPDDPAPDEPVDDVEIIHSTLGAS